MADASAQAAVARPRRSDEPTTASKPSPTLPADERDASSSVGGRSSSCSRRHPNGNGDNSNSGQGHRRSALFHLPPFFKATLCTFEGTRDFCARERTFFVWVSTRFRKIKTEGPLKTPLAFHCQLRLSTTLMVLGGALVLRLQLTGKSNNKTASMVMLNIPQRRALRRILKLRAAMIAAANATSSASSSLIPTTHALADFSLPIPDSHFPLSPNLGAPSIIYGALFFLLSLLALSVGLYDFMRCSRCLEQFDHYGAIQASEGYGAGPGPAAAATVANGPSSPSRPQRTEASAAVAAPAPPRPPAVDSAATEAYDAAQAIEAHSGRVVHVTTVLIAACILFVAVLLVADDFLEKSWNA
ncbi:hypothetical protein OC844_002822 [Tilletia horrida]|nr:hypothetical protein OC844_002822 [Tilletia horrida]